MTKIAFISGEGEKLRALRTADCEGALTLCRRVLKRAFFAFFGVKRRKLWRLTPKGVALTSVGWTSSPNWEQSRLFQCVCMNLFVQAHCRKKTVKRNVEQLLNVEYGNKTHHSSVQQAVSLTASLGHHRSESCRMML